MNKIFVFLLICFVILGNVGAESFQADVAPLIESSCIHCHDADTETSLNFEQLGYDIDDPAVFRKWERVFDRVHDGEMPPESEDRPDRGLQQNALDSLERSLRETSLALQAKEGRVPERRLTKLEYGHTIRDLLSIEGEFEKYLPAETNSTGFDTVGSEQRISAVHMNSYLTAADKAIDRALNLNRRQFYRQVTNFDSMAYWHTVPYDQGGSMTRPLQYGDGYALFADLDYISTYQFAVAQAGIHRITTRVAAYQSDEPITAKVIVKSPTNGARIVQAVDLEPRRPQTLEVDAFLEPGDTAYVTWETGMTNMEAFSHVLTNGGAPNFKGKGLAILHQQIEGPITDDWPPKSTQQLLNGTNLVSTNNSAEGPYEVQLPEAPIDHVTQVIGRLAPRAFRRPLVDGELESFAVLAEPAIAEGREFVDVLRVPLRSMLSSPSFMMFNGRPGPLDDYALANRLSYFLWKSMPDDELFGLAARRKLTDPKVLAAQVDRMLADDRSSRFVRDFLGQWLMLYNVNATSPDENLYPEFDELLGKAIPQEPELFFNELVQENLSLGNLIDSDFTYVNSSLAKLYGIPGVTGQHLRRIELPKDGPRGGILTQAAILKTTANGTVTSPVTRGNFVLTNLLGTPPSPPPPSVGSIEPDTRGQTTIREILTAHRDIETCNKCHREIDPPGFALESFNPIGGFRTKYRANTGATRETAFLGGAKTFKDGLDVDPSGVTADGKPFAGIEEFKQHLMDQMDRIAENFISRLIVYSTGAEIQFADCDEVEAILERTKKDGFPVRDIIHEVVQSRLFREL